MRRIINAFCSYLSKRKLRRRIIKKKVNIRFLLDSDLSYMNLSDIDMRGAKMTASNLKKTLFKNTLLQGAVINSANLSGANLSDAKLIFVNFSGSDLRGANLRGANLYKTNFDGANLSYADLTGAKIDITTNFTNAIMINVIIDINRLNIAITSGAKIQHMNGYDHLLHSLSLKSYNKKKITPANFAPVTY
jgi:uncharacterized protein YjbI with pentapeptide repeats